MSANILQNWVNYVFFFFCNGWSINWVVKRSNLHAVFIIELIYDGVYPKLTFSLVLNISFQVYCCFFTVKLPFYFPFSIYFSFFYISVTSIDIQKIKKTVDNLYVEKQKMEKEKNKKGGKGKTKARLRMEGDNVSETNTIFILLQLLIYKHFLQATITEYGYTDSYDYDDFM